MTTQTKSAKKIEHPITHDMHYGAPAGCSAHRTLSLGSFHDSEQPDARAVLDMICGGGTNKMLQYLGCSDGVHCYIYSYDTYTLGVVEFSKNEPTVTVTGATKAFDRKWKQLQVLGHKPIHINQFVVSDHSDTEGDIALVTCEDQRWIMICQSGRRWERIKRFPNGDVFFQSEATGVRTWMQTREMFNEIYNDLYTGQSH